MSSTQNSAALRAPTQTGNTLSAGLFTIITHDAKSPAKMQIANCADVAVINYAREVFTARDYDAIALFSILIDDVLSKMPLPLLSPELHNNGKTILQNMLKRYLESNDFPYKEKTRNLLFKLVDEYKAQFKHIPNQLFHEFLLVRVHEYNAQVVRKPEGSC